jgi:hypothetical protein
MSEDCMWFACSMVRYAGVWPANWIHEVGMVMAVGFPIGLFLPVWLMLSYVIGVNERGMAVSAYIYLPTQLSYLTLIN